MLLADMGHPRKVKVPPYAHVNHPSVWLDTHLLRSDKQTHVLSGKRHHRQYGWRNLDIRKYNNTAKIGLVGNKMDLVMQNPLKRQVEEAEAAAYARQQGIFLTEFSFQ